jgi:hypothetical protein
LPVWVGGKYQHLVAPPELRLGHSIATAAATLAAQAAGVAAHDRSAEDGDPAMVDG